MDILKFCVTFLALVGVFFFVILFHELYHALTVEQPQDLCFSFTDHSLAYVAGRGHGTTSEFTALAISAITLICGSFVAVLYYLKIRWGT